MIRSVSVENFKAIGPRLQIELEPLTLFVGPNGSGKSSVLEAAALLAQSVRPSDRIGWITDGRLIQLPRPDRLVHRLEPGRRMHLGLQLTLPHCASPSGFSMSRRAAGPAGQQEWGQGLTAGTSDQVEWDRKSPQLPCVAKVLHGSIRGDVSVQGGLDRLLWFDLFQTVGRGDPLKEKLHRDLQEFWKPLADRIAEECASGRLRYVSPLRGGQVMSEEPKGPAASAGAHGENTIRLLSRMLTTADRERRDRLQDLPKRFGLPDLAAGWTGDETLEASYEDPLVRTRLSVRNAGFGSQQALPIIAELADATPGTTLMVEELEHSCHPDWLREWGRVLAHAAKEWGVQVLATTHAPDLVLAAALGAREVRLPPEKVAVYEFQRTMEGVVAVRRALDEHHIFEDGWIETFARAERSLLAAALGEGDGHGGEPRGESRGRKRRRPSRS